MLVPYVPITGRMRRRVMSDPGTVPDAPYRGAIRIVHVETLLSSGSYPKSLHWKRTRAAVHEALSRCCWQPGCESLAIHAASGKNVGERNRAVPLKRQFLDQLSRAGWAVEGRAKNALGRPIGRFDAVIAGPDSPIVSEWKTCSISTSHHSVNRMSLLLGCGLIAAGTLVVPSRELHKHLGDRAGSFADLEPYFLIWKSFRCENGVLELVVIEHDSTIRRAQPSLTKAGRRSDPDR